MDDNKFFKLVWRANSLFFLVVGVLSCILVTFASVKLFMELTRDRNVRNTINVENSEDVTETLKFGHMSTIKGSPYILIPLNSDQNYSQAYFSKSSLSARNYLFLNSNTNEKTWLLKSNDFLVDDRNILYTIKTDDEESTPKAHLFKIIKSDTNSDNRLNSEDLTTIALSRNDGTGYVEVLENIDVLFGHKVNELDTLLVLYEKDNEAFSARIDLNNFKILSNENIPKLNAQQ